MNSEVYCLCVIHIALRNVCDKIVEGKYIIMFLNF